MWHSRTSNITCRRTAPIDASLPLCLSLTSTVPVHAPCFSPISPSIPILVNLANQVHKQIPQASLIPPADKRHEAHECDGRDRAGLPVRLGVPYHQRGVHRYHGGHPGPEGVDPVVGGHAADVRGVDPEHLHERASDGGKGGQDAEEDVEEVPDAPPYKSHITQLLGPYSLPDSSR